jgi:hypothetical protein
VAQKERLTPVLLMAGTVALTVAVIVACSGPDPAGPSAVGGPDAARPPADVWDGTVTTMASPITFPVPAPGGFPPGGGGGGSPTPGGSPVTFPIPGGGGGFPAPAPGGAFPIPGGDAGPGPTPPPTPTPDPSATPSSSPSPVPSGSPGPSPSPSGSPTPDPSEVVTTIQIPGLPQDVPQNFSGLEVPFEVTGMSGRIVRAHLAVHVSPSVNADIGDFEFSRPDNACTVFYSEIFAGPITGTQLGSACGSTIFSTSSTVPIKSASPPYDGSFEPQGGSCSARIMMLGRDAATLNGAWRFRVRRTFSGMSSVLTVQCATLVIVTTR